MPRLSCQGCRASHLLSACPWIAGHTCPTICWSDWCASSCDTMCYCIVCVCLRLHVTEFICSLLGRPDFWYEVCSMWTRCIHWWLHVHSTLHHLVTHQPFHDWHMWTLSSHLCTNSSMKYRVCCRQAKQKSIQHFCHDWLPASSSSLGREPSQRVDRGCTQRLFLQAMQQSFCWPRCQQHLLGWALLLALSCSSWEDSLLNELTKKNAGKYKPD